MSEQSAKVTPSGPDGKNPGTAGPGSTQVQSGTPENKKNQINPSAPNDVNITPNTDYTPPTTPPKAEKPQNGN
jgi:hypothetical protein